MCNILNIVCNAVDCFMYIAIILFHFEALPHLSSVRLDPLQQSFSPFATIPFLPHTICNALQYRYFSNSCITLSSSSSSFMRRPHLSWTPTTPLPAQTESQFFSPLPHNPHCSNAVPQLCFYINVSEVFIFKATQIRGKPLHLSPCIISHREIT